MSSESRDYFRGESAFGFQRWGGTPVTWGLVIALSALWLVYAGTANRLAPGGTLHHVFARGLSLSGFEVVEHGRFWQPATYMFLHPPAGVWSLVYSLAFLFFLGRPLERILGGRRYLAFYVAGGLFAGILAVPWVHLVGAPYVPVASASGAVYAVIAGIALREPGAPSMFLPIRAMVIVLLCIHTAIALTQPYGEVFSFFPLAGAGFAWLQWRLGARIEGRWSRFVDRRRSARDARSSDDQARVQRRLDDLLAKIETEGIGALSAKEKDFLQEASRRFR